MTTVIGVRFKTSGRIYYFDPTGFTIEENDGVIVETARGTEFGEVAQPPHEVEDDQVVQPLKPILRVATAEDRRMRDQNAAKEGDAFRICQKKIEQHQLDMKLVDVEYAFNGSKVVFYFTADERVDFRELVKDLAAQFRTRIELRQIGVRDEAKMLGGLGSCGRPVCCKAFLGDFHPVSIKMAKEQNLSLSPTKISGLCGRLMCCLQYEQAAYEDMKKKMPKTGKEIQTPDGVGTVIENNAVTERTRVRLMMPDGTVEVRDYHYTQLAKVGEPLPQNVVVPERRERTPEAQTMLRGEYIPPEPPKEQADAEKPADEDKPRRRRRGGRRHGGGKQSAEEQGTDAQQKAKPENGKPKQDREPRDGDQPKQGRPPRRRQPKPSGEKQPSDKPKETPQPESGKPPVQRRRRRGGANRGKSREDRQTGGVSATEAPKA